MSEPRLPDDGVLVVGTGYVGRRFLSQTGADSAIGLNRRSVSCMQPVVIYDLDDNGVLPLHLPQRYRLLYTVPPATTAETDIRLEKLLSNLSPVPECAVYISTTGVYGTHGHNDSDLVDELSDTRPSTPRAARRIAAEIALQTWADQHGVRFCVLRTPGIYGPGRLGVDRIREGRPVIRESETNPGNRIHVDDLIACCCAAFFSTQFAGICNVGDGDYRSPTWFAKQVATQSHLAAPPEISREDAAQAFSARRLEYLGDARRVDTRLMREQLGVTPHYADATDGIAASLAEEQNENED